ncbi:hypothetical protein AH06_232 [Erwinia phage AH06]|nr:hypothetical protein AH06_232 [Erwinia phage AH06]
MDTLVVLDLKPVWHLIRMCYDRSTCNTLMITFEQFVNIAVEAYMTEMNAPTTSDHVLEAWVDFGEMQPMPDQSDIAKREICMAGNIIDEQLTYVRTAYFGVNFMGGIRQMVITPFRTLEVHYGKEGV